VLLAAAAPALVALGAAAGDARLEVAVEPKTFGLEDTARLVIRVIGPSGDVSQPELGKLDNVQVVGGPTRSQEFSFINGVSASSVSFSFLLQGVAEGQAGIGPFSIHVGDQVLEADALTMEVVPGSVRPPQSGRRRSPFFEDPFDDLIQRRRMPPAKVVLRHLVGQRKVFVGQPIAAAVVLDTTTGVTNFEWRAAPSYPGWWSQRVEPPEQITPELVEVDGTRFNRFTIARHVLVPLKAEPLVIPAVQARIGVGSRSFFDAGQVVDRESAQIEVEVVHRPPPPEGYAGAVGDLSYTATLEPTEIDFGASAVLTVRLAGSGNLPLVEEPAVWPTCEGCETYPPEEDSQITVDDDGIHGSRTWRVTLIPRVPGELALEPVAMTVFDPRSSSYRRQTLGPMKLAVAPPPATPTPAIAAEKAAEDLPEDRRSETGAERTPLPVLGIGAALLVGLLVGGLVVWLAVRKRPSVIPSRSEGQSPAERARELQVALERWWLDVRARGPKPGVEHEMEQLRRDLEAVRFAPGRADHTETIGDLERRFRELVRRA